MFVHASLVQQIAAKHPEIKKARLVITSEDNTDQMTLKVAVEGADAAITDAIADTIRDVTKLRGSAEIVDAAELPDDGKMIDDARSYE